MAFTPLLLCLGHGTTLHSLFMCTYITLHVYRHYISPCLQVHAFLLVYLCAYLKTPYFTARCCLMLVHTHTCMLIYTCAYHCTKYMYTNGTVTPEVIKLGLERHQNHSNRRRGVFLNEVRSLKHIYPRIGQQF